MRVILTIITALLCTNLNGITINKLTEIRPTLELNYFYYYKNNLIIIEEGLYKKNIELRQYYFDIKTSKMSDMRSIKLGVKIQTLRGIYPRNLNQVIIYTWERELYLLDFETKKILPIDKKIINNDMEKLKNGVMPEIDSYFVIRKINHGISITLLNLQSYKKEEHVFINQKIDEDTDIADWDYYNNSLYFLTPSSFIQCSLRDNSMQIQDVNHDIITSQYFYLPSNSIVSIDLNLSEDGAEKLCIIDFNKKDYLKNINFSYDGTLYYSFIYDRVNLKILAITMGDKKYNVYMLSDIYKSPSK